MLRVEYRRPVSKFSIRIEDRGFRFALVLQNGALAAMADDAGPGEHSGKRAAPRSVRPVGRSKLSYG